jgi:hypothetical protein
VEPVFDLFTLRIPSLALAGEMLTVIEDKAVVATAQPALSQIDRFIFAENGFAIIYKSEPTSIQKPGHRGLNNLRVKLALLLAIVVNDGPITYINPMMPVVASFYADMISFSH